MEVDRSSESLEMDPASANPHGASQQMFLPRIRKISTDFNNLPMVRALCFHGTRVGSRTMNIRKIIKEVIILSLESNNFHGGKLMMKKICMREMESSGKIQSNNPYFGRNLQCSVSWYRDH